MGKVTIIVYNPNIPSSEMEKRIHEQLDKASRSHGDYGLIPYDGTNDTQVFVVPNDEEYPEL